MLRRNLVCILSRHLGQSSRNLPIIEPEKFMDFKLSKSQQLTQICQSLDSMERIRICDDPVMEASCTTNGQSILGDAVCSDVLFIRSFYQQLFQIVRQNRRVILIGNPGISKSVFQYYMLYRFISGKSLGPDSFGSTDAPEVVIRQVGESRMQVWDIKQKQVMDYEGSSSRLLSCFDPKKSVYLYEPEGSVKGPHFGELLIPAICSLSPDVRRYKEFYKYGAVKLYMPTWTLPELQAVRNFVADRNPEQMPLTQDDIAERFHDFGGIYRHIFSPDIELVRKQQEEAIISLDPRKFLLDEIDRAQVSHYIAQYQVTTEGVRAFRDAHIDFISVKVQNQIKSRFSKLDLEDKIMLLKKNDEMPTYMPVQACHTYEEVTEVRLLQGVHWQKKNLIDSHFVEFKLKLTKIVEGKPPVFDDMESGVLYKSFKGKYPAVEMMYKTKEGLIYGLQVTGLQDPTRKIKTSAVDQWLDAIGLKNNKEKVRIAVIPKPALAEKFKAEYEGDGNGYPQLEVWKVPFDYSQQI